VAETFDDDGCLSVVDLKKDMIKTGGENVAGREVEEALYRLDGVAEVAVSAIGHPHWIEAVAVPRADVTFTAAQVIDHAKAHLAGYKCPKYVVFADRFPKNPTGKIVQRELRNDTKDSRRTAEPPKSLRPAGTTADTAGVLPSPSEDRGTRVPPGPTGPPIGCP
jgi:acyl-CoA synthetase (AMP-forming)/AMP-acid ligase II